MMDDKLQSEMTNKSPYEQIEGRRWELTEYQDGIEVSSEGGSGSIKNLLARLGRAKSQVDVEALKEALKQADALHIGDGNPLTDLSWLTVLQNNSQTLLTLLEGE